MPYEVTIAPLRPAAMINLRADEDTRAVLAEALPTGLPEEANTFITAGAVTMTWLGPDEWLVAAPIAQEETLLELVERATAGRHAAATLVSDQYAGFRLSGLQCREVLAQGCILDLRAPSFPVGSSARTLVAGITVLLRHVDDQDFDLVVDRSLARHLERWLFYAIGH